MKPTHILLTRHGQTVTNREGRFCGHSETALTPLGVEQARALGRRLAGTRIDAVYTSDYSRAIDTAAIILEGRRLTPSFDPDLRELCYGEWEQRRERDVARTGAWREEFARMRAEDPAWRPPGGETIHEVRARTMAALDRIGAAQTGRTVLVVTHGTAINCMLAAVLGMAPEFTFRISVANCGLNRLLNSRGRYTVLSLNDTAHLVGIESPA
ncbi:MAG: histidine phosphatase family protein [Dehalococcoidia bacterium]